MDLIQSLNIALPLFHCEVVGDFDNHPDFWFRLLKFVSACENLQEFSFGGDQVPDAARNKLRSFCSSRFALARYVTVPYGRPGRYVPPPMYYWKSICSPFSDVDQHTDSKYGSGQTMNPIDNDDDSTCDDMDSFTLENESVEYDLDD
jgi:hypothetical protein